jgi:dephospho-CoA kinase
MQLLSTALRQNFGEDILAKVMNEDIKRNDKDVAVVDGIRRLADIKYLKELPEFKLIYIEADIKKRYERLIQRGENPDDNQKTFEEFQKEHQQEAELQIRDLKQHANFILNNNGTFEDLYKQIDKIIKDNQ